MIGDRPGTIGQGGERVWIYPVETQGFHTRLRNFTAGFLMLIFYAAPWLRIGDQPLIKLSFLSGSFVLFGQPILIYDFYHFVFLALLLALTLFLVSAMFGRIWCGYACPQTVFIDRLLRGIERLVEGPALRRKRADQGPKSAGLLFRKFLKQFIFLLVCVSFSFTLVSYFTGTEIYFAADEWSSPVMVMLCLLTLLAWFDGAYWREQFCVIACPYARFQSVMLDRNTRQVGYDVSRGEPRGRKITAAPQGESVPRGDCIDCGLCVRVCPTGIDIRQGLNQQECISCAKCIDACDSVMTQLKRPRKLIRFDTEAGLNGRSAEKKSVFRPRILVYMALWLALLSFGIFEFINRESFHFRVITLQSDPFIKQGDRIINHFSVKISNQTPEVQSYAIRILEGEEGMRIESPSRLLDVESGKEKVLPVLLSFPESVQATELTYEIRELEGLGLTQSFVRPLVTPE